MADFRAAFPPGGASKTRDRGARKRGAGNSEAPPYDFLTGRRGPTLRISGRCLPKDQVSAWARNPATCERKRSALGPPPVGGGSRFSGPVSARKPPVKRAIEMPEKPAAEYSLAPFSIEIPENAPSRLGLLSGKKKSSFPIFGG